MKRLKITSVLLSAGMCMSLIVTPVSVLADETTAPFESQSIELAESKDNGDITEEIKKSSFVEGNPLSKLASTQNENAITGICGDNLTWALEAGTLTISGSGKMGYWDSNDAPWSEHSNKIRSVVFSGTITSISDYAFQECDSLTSITIPNSVTSIGVGAFGSCTSLTSITIPNSVTSIGDNAFGSCRSLTSITIPNSVTSIPQYAFRSCTNLTSITIPNSVTSIGVGAFSYCENLTSITIPNSVTSIPQYAFRACTNLTSITIPNSVTSIGQEAFSDCKGLTSITIPNSVTEIYRDAFYGTGLISITIPNSVTSIGYVFENCTSLTSITIPNSVTTIEGAFAGCTSLTSITIPSSVTSIGQEAFFECKGLTSITIPRLVMSIGDSAFYLCSSLTSVIIPNRVTSIGLQAFRDCSNLTSITIPNSVTSIEEYAFCDCISLKDVYFCGTEDEWNAINIGKYNEALKNANIHYNVVRVPAKAATCTEAGNIEYYRYTVNGREKFFCDKFGHNEISAEDTIIPALKHDLKEYDAKAATCTEDGFEKYYECSRCHRIFSDAEGENENENDTLVILPKLGHDLEKVEAKDPTKTEAGNIEYYRCKRDGCGKIFSDSEGKNEIKLTDTVVPAIGHELEKVPAKAVTCTEAGNIEYYRCTDDGCEKLFSDKFGQNEINLADTVIAALGHDIVDIDAEEPTCEKSGCESHFKCRKCGKLFSDKYGQHEISEPAAIPATGHKTVYHQGERATCTKAGHDDYYECSVCHKLFSDKAGTNEITEVKTYPATGHNMDTHEAEPATKQSEGNIKYYVCRNCRKIFSDEEGTHEITLADTIIPKLKHDLTHVKAKAATCTEDGNKEYYECCDEECQITSGGCHKKYSDPYGQHEIDDVVITKKSHDIKKVSAEAPTCTKDGHEEYYECTRCHEKYSDKDGNNKIDEVPVIPKLGHEWDEGEVTKEPTCEKKGTKTFKCIHDGCKKTKTEDIDPLGHDPQPVRGKRATRDNDGNKGHYVCSRCGKKFWDKACKRPADDKEIVIPAIGAAKLGEKATVGGLEYQVTNASTNGTGTVTLTGVAKQAENVSIPGTVVIKETTYMVTVIKAEAFSKNTTVKSVVIGENVLTIDSKAFYGCSSLTSVTGGDNVITIGTKAFAGCKKLKTFKITSPVLAKIGSSAFSGDKKLKTVYIKNTTKLTKSGVKKSLKGSKVKTVKVKKSKVKAYKKIFKKKNSGRTVKVKK